MRVRILLASLAVLLAASPGLAGDHGLWQLATRPSHVVPFPDVASVVNGGAEVYSPGDRAPQFAGAYQSVRPQPRGAPWRYAPEPYCEPPVCLPSHWWPNYAPFGPIHLIVNAGTGQIRRILP